LGTAQTLTLSLFDVLYPKLDTGTFAVDVLVDLCSSEFGDVRDDIPNVLAGIFEVDSGYYSAFSVLCPSGIHEIRVHSHSSRHQFFMVLCSLFFVVNRANSLYRLGVALRAAFASEPITNGPKQPPRTLKPMSDRRPFNLPSARFRNRVFEP